MNKISKNTLILATAIVFACWAGRYDFADQIIPTMPEEVYQAIKAEMPDASDVDIANEYVDNKKYWDAFAFANEYR